MLASGLSIGMRRWAFSRCAHFRSKVRGALMHHYSGLNYERAISEPNWVRMMWK